eukprot:scaffold246478_cov37-Prasinocladus_malaysianus.AAC.1
MRMLRRRHQWCLSAAHQHAWAELSISHGSLGSDLVRTTKHRPMLNRPASLSREALQRGHPPRAQRLLPLLLGWSGWESPPSKDRSPSCIAQGMRPIRRVQRDLGDRAACRLNNHATESEGKRAIII